MDNSNIAANAAIAGSKLGSLTTPLSTLDADGRGGWVTGVLPAPTSNTYLGNRSNSLLFPGDMTSFITPGMRLRTTRTVPAPTQSALLNGTTQYFSKVAPAGMTFTNNFVVSAWVKPTSYATGIIASRYNGTSGWGFLMLASGQVQIIGNNASAVNFKALTTSQSLPLNKWTHITAQLDMTSATNSPTVNYIMFDGADVPATQATSGTNPTALIQAGDLEVGAWNGATLPLKGTIAQVAVFSAKVTQATMQSYYSQGIDPAAPNLISAYSLSGATGLTDLNTTNANNLTANGSAVTTNADAPFGGQAGGAISSTLDYGEITDISFSTNTTVTVRTSEGNTIPTSGGISAVAYSSSAYPFGMLPISNILGKAQINTNFATTSTTLVDITGLSVSVTVPSGRQIRISLSESFIGLSGATTYAILALSEGATVLQMQLATSSGAGSNILINPSIVISPTAGAHTYKAQMDVSTGTGTINAGATPSGAAGPGACTLIVELV